MILRTPSNAALLKAATLPRHERGGGIGTTPLVTPAIGNTGFITGYTSFPGGAQVPFHSHDCAESVVLMEGRAALDIDGREYELEPQDATYIAPGTPHRFRNLSPTEPMKILWIYASATATRTLISTGATHPVCAEHGNPPG